MHTTPPPVIQKVTLDTEEVGRGEGRGAGGGRAGGGGGYVSLSIHG